MKKVGIIILFLLTILTGCSQEYRVRIITTWECPPDSWLGPGSGRWTLVETTDERKVRFRIDGYYGEPGDVFTYRYTY